jgi:glyceraldehyde 3-phosphate dehydrogenase
MNTGTTPERRSQQMTIKVGINGFGRIGRQSLKAMLENYADDIEVVAFNDIGDLPTMFHLLKYDSNYGHFPGELELKDDGIVVNGKLVKHLSDRDPSKLPWGDLGVEIVIESTGFFRKRAQAALHLAGGAKKVIISAPSGDADVTIVLGVNTEDYDPAKHDVMSNASCTTNCVAPVAKVLSDAFGIEKALMTTVHSYTNDQKILDLPHSDLRRARAAALNMIPTTTGAAIAAAKVVPAIDGLFDGMAMRVPTPTVSLVDMVALLKKDVTVDGIHAAMKAAANGPMKGILAYSDEPLVSMDYKGNPNSSIYDSLATIVIGGNLVKVLSWYDNEWAYSCRVADLVKIVGDQL